MTRLAIISDVHADVHALCDALVQVDRLGIDRVVCCGDLLDYGLFPDETLALLRERRVATIRGNHDRWALSGGGDASGWDLSEASRAFLGALPARWCARVGGLRVLAAHARPGNDTRGIAADTPDSELVGLLDASAADVLLVGHTHAPFARALRDGRLVCNPGALLRDPAPGFDLVTPGTFGVLTVAGPRSSWRDDDHLQSAAHHAVIAAVFSPDGAGVVTANSDHAARVRAALRLHSRAVSVRRRIA